MKVMLKDVRIAFCQSLLVPEQYQNKGPFRHSAQFLVAVGSDNDKKVWAAIKAVAAEKWPKKVDSMIDSLKGNSNKFFYQNGDLKDYDGYAGMFYIGAHRKQADGAPLLLDNNKAKLIRWDSQKDVPALDNEGHLQWAVGKEGRIYAGCFVNASVDVYAQDGENSGIRCGLIAVQFNRDGDSFSGATKSNGDEFEDLGEGAHAEEDALA